jgi:TatD DNase family protein
MTHGITLSRRMHIGRPIRHRRLGASSAHDGLDRYPLPSGRARAAPPTPPRCGPGRVQRAWPIACCPQCRWVQFRERSQMAHQFGDSYALGIHPLYTPRAQDGDLAMLDQPGSAMLTTRAWWPWARSGWTTSCPAWTTGAPAALLPRAAAPGAQARLPVILHVRRSADKLLKPLRDLPVARRHRPRLQRQPAAGAAFVDLGFKLGFGGAVTFDRALQIRRLAASLPLDALVLETDAPDIPPHWLYRTAAAARDAGPAAGAQRAGRAAAHCAVLAELRGMAAGELARRHRPMPWRPCHACRWFDTIA